MATELAKAYVQIVPSAEGIKGKITEELGGEAKSAGASAGSSIASGIKKALAAAGIGAALKASLDEGAALQQNIGGIETLFGEGAETMVENANKAFTTAGLSANDYMETVTGFAASLRQAVGGDMAALTSVADLAVIDMADNANKMGTDMALIQNAYQGFAKQNYTMLDNLKLGYGGTKTEMERLLADAEELSGVEYNIDNLSDVYSAIHVIQTELGVTGTTAKEGATTFSGSMASMKAAAQNVLGALTTGQGLSGALSGLMSSVKTFIFDNLFPMIMTALQSLPTVLETALGLAVQMLRESSAIAPEIVTTVITLLGAAIEALIGNAPYLIEAAVQLIQAIGETLVEFDWAEFIGNMIANVSDALSVASMETLGSNEDIITSLLQAITDGLPSVLNKGVEILGNIIDGIVEALPGLLDTASNLVMQFLEVILANLPTILSHGVEIVAKLAQGVGEAFPQIVSKAGELIGQIVTTIIAHLPDILAQGISLVGELIVGLIQAIPDLVLAIPQIITAIIETFKETDWGEIGTNIIDGIKDGITNAAGRIADAAKQAAKKALDGVKNFLGINSPSKVFNEEVGQMIDAGLAKGITGNTDIVKSAMSDLANVTTGNFSAAVGGNPGRVANSAAAMGQSLGSAIQGSRNPIELTMNIDGRAFAHATYSAMEYEGNRRGGSLVL